MSIGMTYNEFWHEDVRLVAVYRKAAELRDKRRNQELWLQGMYIYEALCDASPLFRLSMKGGTVKPAPYVKEPYPITDAEVRERQDREQIDHIKPRECGIPPISCQLPSTRKSADPFLPAGLSRKGHSLR